MSVTYRRSIYALYLGYYYVTISVTCRRSIHALHLGHYHVCAKLHTSILFIILTLRLASLGVHLINTQSITRALYS